MLIEGLGKKQIHISWCSPKTLIRTDDPTLSLWNLGTRTPVENPRDSLNGWPSDRISYDLVIFAWFPQTTTTGAASGRSEVAYQGRRTVPFSVVLANEGEAEATVSTITTAAGCQQHPWQVPWVTTPYQGYQWPGFYAAAAAPAGGGAAATSVGHDCRRSCRGGRAKDDQQQTHEKRWMDTHVALSMDL